MSTQGRLQINSWAIQNLKEQVELLELMVIYYKDFEMDMVTMLMLCDKFKVGHCLFLVFITWRLLSFEILLISCKYLYFENKLLSL